MMENIIDFMQSIVWGKALIYLSLGLGLYFSFKTRFVQVRLLPEMFRTISSTASSGGGLSSFQVFTLGLSTRIGTGNILGVAIAISMGGPGVVFWMWLMALLGAASEFISSTLAQHYKMPIGGQMRGGTAYYIAEGLGQRKMAIAFSGLVVICLAFLLPGIQSSSITQSLDMAFAISPYISGAVITLLLSFIIVGGMKRVGHVAALVVPFMAIGYVLISLVIIVIHWRQIPDVFMQILHAAFGLDSLLGGVTGMAIAIGVRRALYSSGAGMGLSTYFAGSTDAKHPISQGLLQAFSVYIDVFLVCTMTAFVILLTNSYNVYDASGNALISNLQYAEPGANYLQFAMEKEFAGFGASFVAVALSLFAFTSLMTYYFLAESNLAFIESNSLNKKYIYSLRFVFLLTTFFGSLKSTKYIWNMGDLAVGLIGWVNLIVIFLLHKQVVVLLKDYLVQKKQGREPVLTREIDSEVRNLSTDAIIDKPT